ncbi:MAG: hypothetical protein UMR38_04870 [Candidatus Izemoplasma sp.]|nr:hypothetical protein [Candidatus Izemoplasma sp.]
MRNKKRVIIIVGIFIIVYGIMLAFIILGYKQDRDAILIMHTMNYQFN